MDAVVTRGLERVYRGRWGRSSVHAVISLDLRIARGRVFGLLGPNGSGKTTTILMLLGLLPPTGGTIEVLTRPPGHRETRRRTGFLPEETYLYDFLTGEETLHFVGRLFGFSRNERRRRVERLLKKTGMWEARKRRLDTYSKGMARRIGLAQALMSDPQLLILDEPTSGLDPVGNKEVKDLLKEESELGTTVILSSHLLADVADVCDEIAILHRGRKILSGEVSRLLADANRLVWETDAVKGKERARIKEILEREGAAVHHVGQPSTTLEALFLDVLAKEDREDVGGGPA